LIPYIIEHHSIVDVVNERLDKFKVEKYEYKEYIAIIDSLESYYKHSMDMLESAAYKQVFMRDEPIFTKV
jgi:glucose-1-phosphate adenylyltransferase